MKSDLLSSTPAAFLRAEAYTFSVTRVCAASPSLEVVQQK